MASAACHVQLKLLSAVQLAEHLVAVKLAILEQLQAATLLLRLQAAALAAGLPLLHPSSLLWLTVLGSQTLKSVVAVEKACFPGYF